MSSSPDIWFHCGFQFSYYSIGKIMHDNIERLVRFISYFFYLTLFLQGFIKSGSFVSFAKGTDKQHLRIRILFSILFRFTDTDGSWDSTIKEEIIFTTLYLLTLFGWIVDISIKVLNFYQLLYQFRIRVKIFFVMSSKNDNSLTV